MKRFYGEVAVAAGEDGYRLLLDGRAVKTPARAPLVLPSQTLGDAVAEEWRAQGEKVDPRSMPLTGLANAAIDRVAPDPQAFAAGLARYGETDLICYRAERPAPLVARQAALWDPFVDWARSRYDIEMRVVSGVVHRPQPEATTQRLARAVEARSAFELAGLSPLVTIGGSLVIALGLAEGAFAPDEAWAAAALDDHWQAEQWGEDAEATAALEERRRAFEGAARFFAALR